MVAILPDDFFRGKSFKGGWRVAAQNPKIQTLQVFIGECTSLAMQAKKARG